MFTQIIYCYPRQLGTNTSFWALFACMYFSVSGLANEEAFFEDDYTADYSATDGCHENFPEVVDNHPINFDDVSGNTNDASHAENKESSDGVNTETNDSKVTAEKSEEAQQTTERPDPIASEGQVSVDDPKSKERDEKESLVSPDT